MLPSPHTQLMNRVIGLCTRTKGWPSTFAEYGYEVQLIEQSFTTTGGGYQVKPDIIIASEKYRNIIFFDCKGGQSIEREQVARYDTLTPADIERWVRLHNKPVSHDLCLTFRILEAKHEQIVAETVPHPLLVLGNDDIKKIRKFKVPDLDKAFSTPISLAGMYPPLSHYPFSDQDDKTVILPIVLRKLVQLALERSRGGPSALDNSTFDNPMIVKSTHPYWEALSNEHQKRLSDKVQKIMKELVVAELELQNHIQDLESREGFKVRGPLSQLQKVAERIIDRLETQPQLKQFFQQ